MIYKNWQPNVLFNKFSGAKIDSNCEGFYELHEGGRRAHGSYAHKDRQVGDFFCCDPPSWSGVDFVMK